MHRVLSLVALFLFSASLVGCATILKGPRQDIQVNSNPAGARILVNGQDMGQTPTTLSLKRGESHQVTYRMAGYEDVTINIEKNFAPMRTVVGNLFSWALIGIVVDVANGSAYDLSPEQLNAAMRATGQTAIEADRDELLVYFFTPEQLESATIR